VGCRRRRYVGGRRSVLPGDSDAVRRVFGYARAPVASYDDGLSSVVGAVRGAGFLADVVVPVGGFGLPFAVVDGNAGRDFDSADRVDLVCGVELCA